MNEIEKYNQLISKICAQHNVKTMYAFGSVLTDHFDSDSDIDLLVNFNPADLENYFDNYIMLKEKLEHVLNRKVDLLEEQSLKNPILIRSINKNKKLIYG